VESVEASGKSIEDAILQALARLGRNRDEVEIQVLQEPSRGNRGMGVREARVRVFVKAARSGMPEQLGYGTAVPSDVTDEMLPAADEGDDTAAYGAGNGSEADYGDQAYQEYPETYEDESLYGAPHSAGAPGRAQPLAALRDALPEDASIEEMAVVALQTILGNMGMPAAIEVAEPTSPETEAEEPLTLNIRTANDQQLSLLIGRRGETLAALQLLVNLIIAKQTGHHERIIVDAEGYRQRREDNLRSMAQRIATQVRRSGTPIMLEAMPPNERRIIHIELAASPDISTESTGEGDQRRVVVSLKRVGRASGANPQG
jgi:spoIIIJ-associated protein